MLRRALQSIGTSLLIILGGRFVIGYFKDGTFYIVELIMAIIGLLLLINSFLIKKKQKFTQ
ncbi:hypothetical protein ACFSTH_14720 [Paenibacillus yanchengensis]|uniref:Uncharacterized protein n=1 Tax=Paenibacillus yanchengensis TaxID=2035833 RepID=A0ABW4YEW9_9BACL